MPPGPLRFCMSGLQRAGPALARDLLARASAAGWSVQVAQCLDRCPECEKGFVAQVDGTFTAAPSARAFLEQIDDATAR